LAQYWLTRGSGRSASGTGGAVTKLAGAHTLDSVEESNATKALFRRYREGGDRSDRDELVCRHRWVARYCANRFARRGEPYDDLVQVAQLGVLKAVERYDPDFGIEFAGFAIPTVMGELRRHFRDATWAIHVGRRPKDLSVTLRQAIDTLHQRLRRTPTVDELAQFMQVSNHDVIVAMEALEANCVRPLHAVSDETRDDPVIARSFGREDGGLDGGRISVRLALRTLPTRERQLIYLRFYEGLTQSEIADRCGTTQVQVSRQLRRIFRKLAPQLDAAS
jgi:RNA polymerase sigma-B factor